MPLNNPANSVGGDAIISSLINFAKLESAPIDILNGWIDGLQSTDYIDLTASSGENVSVAGQISNFVEGTNQIPAMTSYTAPEGVVTASSNQGSYEAWRAMDRANSNYWSPTNALPRWLAYEFDAGITDFQLAAISLQVFGTLYYGMPTSVNVYKNDVLIENLTPATWDSSYQKQTLELSTNEPITGGDDVKVEFVTLQGSGNGTLAEVELISAGIPNNANIILKPKEIGIIPNALDLYLLLDNLDSGIIDTDIKFYGSRNNNAAFEQSYLAEVIGEVSGLSLIKASCTLTGQTSGNQIAAKIETLNNKNMAIKGLYINAQ